MVKKKRNEIEQEFVIQSEEKDNTKK